MWRYAIFGLSSFLCTFMFLFPSLAEARITIITGSYSSEGLHLASERVRSPAFSNLGAYIIHSKSREFAARVAVGCFESEPEARKVLPAVLMAGAKGVWLLHVSSCGKSIGGGVEKNPVRHLSVRTAGSTVSYPLHLDARVGKAAHIRIDQPNHTSVATIASNTIADPPTAAASSSLPINRSRVVNNAAPSETGLQAPSKAENVARNNVSELSKAGNVDGNNAPDLSEARNENRPQEKPFTPARWVSKDGTSVAFTSGKNPSIFTHRDDNGRQSCLIAKRIYVPDLLIGSISHPLDFSDYEFSNPQGVFCSVAYIYIIKSKGDNS